MDGDIQTDSGSDEPAVSSVLPASVRRDVFVVIPAYNESTRVGEVVRQVRSLYPNVVVIDDGSMDDSVVQASAAGAMVLRHAVNRGQGASLQTGIDFSLTRGAKYIVTFDSDGQHRVDDISTLIQPIIRGEWEISLGSRFIEHSQGIPPIRRVLLRCGVVFTRIVSRVDISDTHNGLRAFSKNAAEKINITLDRMAHASELIDQIRDSGCKYGEVPVHIHYTDYSQEKGQSGFAAIRILFHYFLKRLTG